MFDKMIKAESKFSTLVAMLVATFLCFLLLSTNVSSEQAQSDENTNFAQWYLKIFGVPYEEFKYDLPLQYRYLIHTFCRRGYILIGRRCVPMVSQNILVAYFLYRRQKANCVNRCQYLLVR